MKKILLVTMLLLQTALLGCGENQIDPVANDKVYLEKHNEMSAEETAGSLEGLKTDDKIIDL